MIKLIDKSYKTYNYTSRYSNLPFYYDKNQDKYIYGLGNKTNKDVSYSTHQVTQKDTLDSLSLDYYGRPDLYWKIAQFNDITDPYINLFENYTYLLIPTKY
jgi:nucleoid-associated protein YgaU